MAGKKPLKVCLASAEFAPLAKTGGLADVCAALSAYFHAQGHDVRVLLPYYRRIEESGLKTTPVEQLQHIPLRLGDREYRFAIDTARAPDAAMHVFLMRCPELWDREALYSGAGDEHIRFAALSHAAILMCQYMGFSPDVFHCHDWHTALIPVLLKTAYRWDRLFANSRTVLTIHNIAYQGIVAADRLGDLGVGDGSHELHQDDLRAGRINFMKTGILHADLLTTVSPTYAQEIQTETYGMGLEDLLRQRQETLVGILNGVDYDLWDPRSDPLIPHSYGPDDMAGKSKNKSALMSELGLDPVEGRPLIGMVTRLTSQKGIDLIQQVMPRVLMSRSVAMAILGSGDPRYEQFFAALQSRFRDRVCFYEGYSNELAHWIEAGSDMFLMPSLFEPCGLNQMYSLRYGTVPIVRQTGGLADTVELWDPASGRGTGITFRDYNEAGLAWAVNTALDLYKDESSWRQMVLNGMHKDYSWDRQGAQYIDLFRQLVS